MDEKLLEVFHKNKEVAFATAVDGKPHVRIFQIMKIDAGNNSIYFATSPHKEVYAQLKTVDEIIKHSHDLTVGVTKRRVA